MRRPLWCRALLALWGLWFTAALSEAGSLHSCPLHGNHAVHANHAAPAHASHATPASQNAKHGHDACTCFGPCCCGAPIAAPEQSREVFAGVLVDAPAGQYRDIECPSVDRAHALPFANGPPAAL